MAKKVQLELDKHAWHPGLLAGQVVVITSVDEAGKPNIAPKSWVSMAAFRGPVIGFGCNTSHQTCANIQANRDFVVNIPGDSLGPQIYALPSIPRPERISRSGFTMEDSLTVSAPYIAECRAHLECELKAIQRFGEEVFIFGEIMAAFADSDLLEGEYAERYAKLRSLFFLEAGLQGVIEGASPAIPAAD